MEPDHVSRSLHKEQRLCSSLKCETRAPWEAQRPTAFKLRGTFTVGVWQSQANRAQFGGVPVNEFARYAERARQFTDRHEGIVFRISHTRQSCAPSSRRPPTIAAKSPAPSRYRLRSFEKSALRRAPRGVPPRSRQAIIARRAVAAPVRSAVGFVPCVVALEFSVQSPARDAQHFRCPGLVSVSEFDSAPDIFLLDFLEW
jgi:hypothetical protein